MNVFHRASGRASTTAAALAFALVAVMVAPAARAADTSETRPVGRFENIHLGGAFTAIVRAGEKTTRVVVSGNADAVSRVTTVVRDGTLEVGMKSGGGFSFFNNSPTIAIDVPSLRSFASDGAGSIEIRGLGGGDITLQSSGAGKIVASGRARRATISLNGAGKVDAEGLDAKDVTVENNGVGSIRVRASGTLDATINGVGSIHYAGTPTHVESHVNGLGHIGRV